MTLKAEQAVGILRNILSSQSSLLSIHDARDLKQATEYFVSVLFGASEIFDLRNKVESLESRLSSTTQSVSMLEARLALYITGECTCPPRGPGARHYPGCPQIAQEEIARLKGALDHSHEEFKRVIDLIDDPDAEDRP